MGISRHELMLDALAGRLSRRRALEAIAGGSVAAGLAAAMARNGLAWDDGVKIVCGGVVLRTTCYPVADVDVQETEPRQHNNA